MIQVYVQTTDTNEKEVKDFYNQIQSEINKKVQTRCDACLKTGILKLEIGRKENWKKRKLDCIAQETEIKQENDLSYQCLPVTCLLLTYSSDNQNNVYIHGYHQNIQKSNSLSYWYKEVEKFSCISNDVGRCWKWNRLLTAHMQVPSQANAEEQSQPVSTIWYLAYTSSSLKSCNLFTENLNNFGMKQTNC